MTRPLLSFIVLGFALSSYAQTPEECLVTRGKKTAASATYNNRTYAFTSVECRDRFLTDPERFSQLYDALQELADAGEPLATPPEDASLVPS
jgi:YHS domain-containing protein